MPKIILETKISASLEICFDLSRSIDLHQISTHHTNEKAIDGKTSGLIGLGEYVTWQAKHFGITQKLTSEITAYNRPYHFRDEQKKGVFKSFVHDHYFEQKDNYVLMRDVFDFESPLGFAGKIFNFLVLKRYMTNLLIGRNSIIKQFAESGNWKKVLN
jgi:ligand-binding SRPBCC domain-containing protein